jgi:hypothetical protein
VVAFTDDDCRVSPDWVKSINAAFTADEDLALLFGAVLLRPEDRAGGYAAEFAPVETTAFRHSMPDAQSSWGVGANMAVRRTVFEQIGTFDCMLGAGSPFHAAEEIDLTIRALASDFKVIHTPGISVLHLGIREGAAASRLMRGYGVGLGASFAKGIRLGTPGVAGLLARWVAFHGRRSLRSALRGQRHPGFGLVAAVLWGACRSFEMRIDKASRLYQGGRGRARVRQ